MSRRLLPISLVVCAVVFVVGLFYLFKLRFEAGDVYPEYSSLRADPLGTMAFFESLEQMPGTVVTRDFRPSNQLPEGRGVTYLHLAANRIQWEWMPEDLAVEIQPFLARGGRLAITFHSVSDRFQRHSATEPADSHSSPQEKSGKKSNPPNPGQPGKKKFQSTKHEKEVSLKTKWGVEFGVIRLPHGQAEEYAPVSVTNQSALALPESLAWHTALVFTNLDASWRTIYARGTNPVVVERRFGAGTVVMATDSYFLSNEALRKDPHADLLAWLAGPGKHVVFDEAHFGILENPGVAALMRTYRLHGLAAGLLLLAGLFIWKNSTSFVPPLPEERQPEYVAGRDAAAGFVNLLRRNISPRDVLKICFDEWTRSLGHGSSRLTARAEQAATLLKEEFGHPERLRDPVRVYREMSRMLKSGRFDGQTARPQPDALPRSARGTGTNLEPVPNERALGSERR